MATSRLTEQIQEAFGAHPALCSRVQATLSNQSDNHQVTLVLIEISSYVIRLQQDLAAQKANLEQWQAAAHAATSERPIKKRRMSCHEKDVASGADHNMPAATGLHNQQPVPNYEQGEGVIVPRRRSRILDLDSDKPEDPVLRFEEISFSLPIRKKMLVEFIAANSNGDGSLRARPHDGTFDDGVTLCWDEMEYVFSIPVPERATPASHIVILPRSSNSDTIVLTCPATPPQGFISFDPDVAIRENEMFNALMKRVLNVQLSHMGKRVVVPEEREFVSGVVQAHRKDEKHFFVRAHKGRQSGYLHFLPPGILWGFKKPIVFIPFSNIRSISYTSILSRTFNLVISPNFEDSKTNTKEDVMFEMLDQQDYPGIDDYVKRHRLNDESMAAERRAQHYHVNPPKSLGATELSEGEDDEEVAAVTGEARLLSLPNGDDLADNREHFTMTEQEIQDAEDAEEEDFDPSGGSSDGSGSGSEDEDDGEEI